MIKPTAPIRIFVKPGEGVKVPLRVGGMQAGSEVIPAEGKSVIRTMHVVRLLRTGDLVEAAEPGLAVAAKAPTQLPAAAKET